MENRFHVYYDALEAACRKWGVEKVMIFGSALRDDFSEDSDIDLLLKYRNGTVHSLFDYGYIYEDFQRAFDRKIDLTNFQGLLSSRNERRKHNIFSSAKDLYVLQSGS